MTTPSSTAISDLADHLYWFPLYFGGVGVRAGYSQKQPGVVTHVKSVIVIHTETSYCALWCAFIGEEGGKVSFCMADACDIQLHSKFRRRAKFEVGIYFKTSRENIAYCPPVGNVALFDSHRDAIAAFSGSSVYG